MPSSLENLSPGKTTALVAGGAGFVGSYLCESLLSLDCQVLCVDNFLTGEKRNIEPLQGKNSFVLLEDNINNPDFYIKNHFPAINYIFNLTSVEEYLSGKDISLEIMQSNSIGTENLIALCLKNNAKLLFCSSLEIFKLPDWDNAGQWENLSFHESKRFAERLILNHLKRQDLDLRVVRVGDVYGPRMKMNGGLIGYCFDQLLSGQNLKIPAEGEGKIYPLYVKDAVSGILRSILVPGTAGKIFDLKPANPITLVDFCQELKKNRQLATDKQIEIEYVAQNSFSSLIESTPQETENPLGWRPEYTLEDGIKETLREFSRKPAVKEQKTRPRKTIPKFLLFIPASLAVALMFIILIFFQLVYQMKEIQRLAGKGDFVDLENKTLVFQKEISLLGPIAKAGQFVWGNQEKTIALGENLADSLLVLSRVGKLSNLLFLTVIGSENQPFKEALSSLQVECNSAIEKVSVTNALLNSFTGREKIVGPKILEIKKFIPEIKKFLLIYRDFLVVSPKLLGADQGIVYLFLFQNNMELRPGGGFIGSYGLASFESGKLFHFGVGDVYDADGQLKGHVEPPVRLKELLGVDGWYLRDSNWSPDFGQNAIRAKWFLEKETGRQADAVIGINLNAAQKLIKVFGELKLPDYRETINADNFFQTAEYYIEAGFFPGSKQKEDFLGQVAQVLMDKIKSADAKTKIKIFQAMMESLNQRDILISSNDSKIAAFLEKNHWDGIIENAVCQKSGSCLSDYLMVNEANVGVNKANYFLVRSISRSVQIQEDGGIKETLRLDYENKSPSNVFPAGDYKAYLRILVNSDSSLIGCQIANQECQVEQSSDLGKKIFGLVLTVPVGRKQSLEIVYQLPESQKFISGQYLAYIQKQSGFSSDPYKLSISYPVSSAVSWSNFPILTEKGSVVYNTSLSEDRQLEISLIK
ncbi:hypothetical protein COT44_03330 [Candidatus Shapirobacteria bacterium CG08_land_8_20_14_0_20_39_18]|uniref:NAD-dependent epimerase/dehydratase domain-containing protein n=1 Tax=Candidatus Shapirobacteria bacterium CG08_land_8_20_14_0_20_39_18 TaxID=1974883 RepID=A0A2M6XCR2_9BACT|nr:MAG: hypothetical protein COT44_03330 [Candidatus Shapirobacteria bacterium CG08_land_8_20_14_0_20_39_18]PIY65092.1 MAG: hypothetical protein COY91_03440 [Candidatus Shapirobacteria bacterium CG_4_10_14_0_8_um_filter_39_15]